jgi:hypothetical protein
MKRTRKVVVDGAKEELKKRSHAHGKPGRKRKREDDEIVPSHEGDNDMKNEIEIGANDEFGLSVPKKSKILSFKLLSEGTAILAVVKNVNENDIVLALPNNLLGYARATELSDVYTASLRASKSSGIISVVRPGQWVRAVVSALRITVRNSFRFYLLFLPPIRN